MLADYARALSTAQAGDALASLSDTVKHAADPQGVTAGGRRRITITLFPPDKHGQPQGTKLVFLPDTTR